MRHGLITLASLFAFFVVLIPIIRALRRWEARRESADTTLVQHILALLTATRSILSVKR